MTYDRKRVWHRWAMPQPCVVRWPQITKHFLRFTLKVVGALGVECSVYGVDFNCTSDAQSMGHRCGVETGFGPPDWPGHKVAVISVKDVIAALGSEGEVLCTGTLYQTRACTGRQRQMTRANFSSVVKIRGHPGVICVTTLNTTRHVNSTKRFKSLLHTRN